MAFSLVLIEGLSFKSTNGLLLVLLVKKENMNTYTDKKQENRCQSTANNIS